MGDKLFESFTQINMDVLGEMGHGTKRYSMVIKTKPRSRAISSCSGFFIWRSTMGFMVCNAGKFGKKPRVIHPTMGLAIAEAARLAEKTGNKLLILEVAGSVKFVGGEIKYSGPEEI